MADIVLQTGRAGSPVRTSLAIGVVALLAYFPVFIGETAAPGADLLRRAELALLDLRFRYRGPIPPDPRIVLVTVDQRAQEVFGRWPFPRAHFAALLDVLREDGAAVAAFDIVFAQPGEPEQDKQFAESIGRFPRLAVGCFFFFEPGDALAADPAARGRYAELLAYHPFREARSLAGKEGAEAFLNTIELYESAGWIPAGGQPNTAALSRALQGPDRRVGFLNIPIDPDGAVRWTLLALPYGRSLDRARWDFYPSLDVQAAGLFLGDWPVLSFDRAGIVDIAFGQQSIPTDAVGRILVNYRGPEGTYPSISMANAVLRNFPTGFFQNKLVLVGVSASGLGDVRMTPFGLMPGIEIHANVVDNLLNSGSLRRGTAQVASDITLILLCGLVVGLFLRKISPGRLWMSVALLLPLLAAGQLAFQRGWYLNLLLPILVVMASTMTIGFSRAR